MKKTTTAALIGGIILLLVAVFVILKVSNPKSISIEDGKGYADQSFLNNQQAALYISQEAKKLEEDQAKGSLVFINHMGKVNSYVINAVEYGNLVVNKHNLMIEQSNKMVLLSDKLHKTKFDTAEYRGIRAGYLPVTNQYYSVYNSGLSDKYDYKMTVRYSNEAGVFHSLTIPNFVTAVGEDKDSLLLVTQDLVSNEFQLKRMELNESKHNLKLITDLHLPDSSNVDIVSQVASDEENFYFVVSNFVSDKKEKIILCAVNRKTQKVQQHLLAQYKTLKETETSIPVTYNDSLHILEGKLYYANGRGQVYKYDKKTNKTVNLFKLSGFPEGEYKHAQIRFTNKFLYAIYPDKEKHIFLDSYDLQTTKRVQHEKIKGLKKYVKDEDIFTNLTIFPN